MKIITTPQEMQAYSRTLKQQGKTIAAVPTMGALHKGHLALVDRAKELADSIVMSIFVNPTQFNESADFDNYPRTFKEDCRKAEVAGCDVIFAPTAKGLYPEGFGTTVTCGAITARLEGATRSGHFDGVTTVVLKLLTAITPDFALFGQKDAQQLLVISQMVRDLNLGVKIVACHTVRDADGLAKSSRNQLLTRAERAEVSLISKGLFEALGMYEQGEVLANLLRERVLSLYQKATTFTVEYVAMTNRSCEAITVVPQEGALLSVACRCSGSDVRLIDNVTLGPLWEPNLP